MECRARPVLWPVRTTAYYNVTYVVGLIFEISVRLYGLGEYD